MVGLKPRVEIPTSFDVPMDWRVFVFALGTAVVVGALFGLLPGLKSTAASVAGVVKEEAAASSARSRTRSAVVVGHLAFPFVLLIAGGLVGKSLGSALRIDPGFNRNGIQVA